MKKLWLTVFCCGSMLYSLAQQDSTAIEALQRTINLSEVVVRSDLNVPRFLQRVRDDSSFYKAFKNLRLLSYTSLNDISMLDKKGKVVASLHSKTRQNREGACRTMEVLEEKRTGDLYDENGDWNYYTAQIYASLFFTKGKVCGETNIVGNMARNIEGSSGLSKHKEQLKMLLFNPGKKIPGIPFIGNKLDIFDERVRAYYNYAVDLVDLDGRSCYLFSINAKNGLSRSEKSDIVFDEITTWFDVKSLAIVARNYSLSYNAGVYDFDVQMGVELASFNGLLVPRVLRYKGNWHVAFKKREQGLFTATLFDFEQ